MSTVGSGEVSSTVLTADLSETARHRIEVEALTERARDGERRLAGVQAVVGFVRALNAPTETCRFCHR